MDLTEQEKGKAFIITELIAYEPNSVEMKMIIKRTTGNIMVSSFDTGEIMTENTSPFDTFIQIIHGKAQVIIEGQSHQLETGQAIIIPAHSRNSIIANVKFKIISMVIKSGYEDVTI